MTPSSSDESLIERLLALPAAERGNALERACAGDPSLRDRVQEIMEALAKSEDLSRTPSGGRPSPDSVVQAFNLALEAAPSEAAGARIGPYKLLQEIGRGGFGVVWMAEQEGPLRRRVALKIIKAGMDTKEVIARFEAERQALALMDHTNIARVFDAGATEAGRPYFVMELVRGVAITHYCDENRLPVEARLRLFMTVCQAVQHAHQKGVIHRDLKPTNILVTLHDGVPVPKVIDFGIAKATISQLTEKTLFTQFHAFIGTPAYTSPEQMEMSGLDVDTRSDIYSLGVLLYELLAGRPPFDSGELIKSGLEAMRRTLREVDPPRPSQRLATLAREERVSVAQQRGTDAARLPLLISGDLDWIVMRCLEKDRTRRYETATGLAADVQRYLENQPVAARPPTNAYRLRKFIRRHRLGFAAATAIAASLVAGLIASSALLVRERAAHARAVENLRRAQAAEAAALDAKSDAQRSREQADTARREAEQLLTYLLGEFQGKLLDTGQIELLEQLARRTVGYYERLPAELITDSTDRNHALALASLGSVLNRENRLDEAAKLDAESVAVFRRRIGAGDRSIETAEGLSLALETEAALYDSRAQGQKALPLMREAVAVLRPFMAVPRAREALQPILARRLLSLGYMQRNSEGMGPMERTMMEAAEMLEASGGADAEDEDVASDYSAVLLGLSYAAVARHDLTRATQCAEQAIAVQNAILKKSPSRVQMFQQRAGAYSALGYTLYFDGKLSESVAAFEQAIRDDDFYLHLNPEDAKVRQVTIQNKTALATEFRELGRLADARAIERASLAGSSARNNSGAISILLALGYRFLAWDAAEMGDRKGAEDGLAEMTHYFGLFGKDAPAAGFPAMVATENPRISRLVADYALGEPPKAIQDEARAIAAELQGVKSESWGGRDRLVLRSMLERADDAIAQTALDLGQFADAEAAAKEAGDLGRSVLGELPPDIGGPDLAGSERRQAEAVARQGRCAEARAIIDPLVAAARKGAEAEPENVSRRQDLADLLMTQEIAQDPASRAARRSLLDEAQVLIAGMPGDVAGTASFRRAEARLDAERAKVDRGP